MSELTLSIRGEKIPYKHTRLKTKEVNFYVDNPRIYSYMKPHLNLPESALQEKIYNHLKEREHVKDLKKRIQAHGDLMTAIRVEKINNKYYALEGNSRLACYKELLKLNTSLWKDIKCDIFLKELTEEQRDSILAEEHIHGKTEWATYEKSYLLYRKHHEQNVSILNLSKRYKLTEGEVKYCIETIKLMEEVVDKKHSHYSHYHVVTKSRKTKQKIDTDDQFRRKLISGIKNERLLAKEDIRDKLTKMINKDEGSLDDWTGSTDSLNKIMDNFVDSGGTDAEMSKATTFLKMIQNTRVQSKMVKMEGNKRKRMMILFRQIFREIKKLRVRLGDSEDQQDLED